MGLSREGSALAGIKNVNVDEKTGTTQFTLTGDA
jgi:hypothetical protein